MRFLFYQSTSVDAFPICSNVSVLLSSWLADQGCFRKASDIFFKNRFQSVTNQAVLAQKNINDLIKRRMSWLIFFSPPFWDISNKTNNLYPCGLAVGKSYSVVQLWCPAPHALCPLHWLDSVICNVIRRQGSAIRDASGKGVMNRLAHSTEREK